jgi:uncharacterized protein
MKKTLFTILFISCVSVVMAQKAPYNVVIDITSPDTLTHKMAMNWVREIIETDPNANVEMVFYGKSLPMITKDKSIVADAVKKYAEKPNVSFKVCEVAMKNNNVNGDQLITGVKTVPDGIYEIISKQHEGWGYIKAAR